uniref:PDZ domain-containing protein n=1 Tax=Macrostomum lignano TaxID=282301 RepID=A0A1I8HL37_9PLAT
SASVSKTGSGSRLSSVSSSSADSGGCSNGIASRETGAAALSTHSAAAAAAASAAASGTSTERRPRPGSVRQVRMDKGSEPLGIRIHAGQQGGIYISTVQPGSLADRAGLLAGDRILEFCGVNLRTAFYHNAKQVLNDCREETGILVSDVPAESAGQGLRPGDLILQCNGVDFRGLTAESASQELGRAAAATDEETRLLVQHRPARLAAIGSATEPDALFVRPNFSQLPAVGGVVDGDEQQPPPEPLLAFRRHDLLLVTDTRPAGRPAGWWFAWLLDGAGQRVRSGFMPSPRRLQQQQQQQQLALMQNPAAGGLGSRSVSLRRSAGKRGGTSSSSSSSASASASASTADYLHPHLRLPLPAYSRAELVPDPGRAGPRPVAILGPLSEALGRALCAERSDLFYPLGPLPLDRVAGACGGDSAKHGLLQLASGPAQVDQLHRLHRVYPIVLLLRYRSHKLVKEARDPRYCPEKFPSRVAKDMVAKAAQLEEELQPVLTACIQGGAFAFMCSQVVSVVSRDQNCPVWINAEPIVP